MIKQILLTSLFTLAISFGPAHSQQTPFGINGPLKVCGNFLCNQYGNPIQLRGISTHGLQWYPWGDCLNDGSLNSLIKDWGADILRVSMYMQESGWTTNKTKYTAMVDQVIEAATAKGLYVIVDFHQLSPGDPNANLDNAIEYFTHMVPKHGPKGNVLYEICNEPSGVKWSAIKQYADKVIPVIRKFDTKSPILVGTMGWSSLGVSGNGPWSDITASPITDGNHMYTFHFYAADHGNEYRSALSAAADKLPMFISEFGSQEATGGGSNDFASTQSWLDLLAQKKISWVNWNFSDDQLSGAVLKGGTCPNGPWTGSSLKEAGTWIQSKMNTPDNFQTGTTLRRESAAASAFGSKLAVAALTGAVKITVDLEGAYRLDVRSAAGKVVKSLRGNGPRGFALDRATLAPGIHIVELRQGRETAGRTVVF